MHASFENIAYRRLPTREVAIGGLLLGNYHPIRIQTMTTTDTMDTKATVAQTIRCIEAGAELVRITAPSKKEAENLANIKAELRKQGYTTPLVADIHFTPNAAEIAARIVEKVRINPGNYVDKKKFELIEYSDADYAEEIERIRERFTPLLKICKEWGTAMRIGTNHGSLSDRIMSRYGDTPVGMVESAMEFLRIARAESYHNIVLSMKSSNPQVMVQAYRLLVQTMQHEFGECYPLHLGVTEAGDGEDGRIKSAIGIGTLLEEGLGDTIRVSLTEDPEAELPVCKDLVKRYSPSPQSIPQAHDAAKAPSRWEGEIASENVMEEDTVGYRFADPHFYKLLHAYAKQHRAQPMPAEKALWNVLQTKQLEGYKFRRQHIIDRFITDFVCLKKRLIIEIDGSIHSLPDHQLSDKERTERLNALDFHVVRFTNEQVLQESEKTIKTILEKLKQLPDFNERSNLSSPTGGQGASRRETFIVNNIGGHQVPVVIADLSKRPPIEYGDLKNIGYTYNEATDKWNISDAAADFIYTANNPVSFALPGTLKVILNAAAWEKEFFANKEGYLFSETFFPIYDVSDYVTTTTKSSVLNFVMLDCDAPTEHEVLKKLGADETCVLCLSSQQKEAVAAVRGVFQKLADEKVKNPVILVVDSNWQTADEHLIHYATEAGALLLDGFGDGICLGMTRKSYEQTTVNASGRNYLQSHSVEQFLNNTAFSILQATRTRISKTEYISCPSCGRTLFDLQETTAKIRSVTHHLKGVKIAIMGCIVNGPGEMADADFGYVGSGPGKITLYKGKDVVKRNVPSEVAVEELIALLKEHGAWVERPQLVDMRF